MRRGGSGSSVCYAQAGPFRLGERGIAGRVGVDVMANSDQGETLVAYYYVRKAGLETGS